MKALVRYDGRPEALEFREVPMPLPDKGHAVLKIEAVGICGRDLEHFRETLDAKKVPFVPGHEFAGTISALPPGESRWKVGDRVTAETVDSVCGTCHSCKAGRYNICKKRKNIGGGMNGAYAPLLKVPLAYLHALPDTVSFEEGAMVEPACVCYNATLVNSDPKPGELTVIIGVGTVGLLCLQMAKLRGATVAIIGLPEDEARLQIGRELGADHILLATEAPVEKVMELTHQDGAPLVIDTVGGSAATIEQALQMVRPGGQITKVGWFMGSSSTAMDTLVRRNVRLQGSFSHTGAMWEECINLIAEGKISAKKMITTTLPLAQWREGFELGFSKQALKVILKP